MDDDLLAAVAHYIEHSPHKIDYVDFGTLTAITRILDAVREFPSIEPTDIAGWCRVYETVLLVLEQLPTGTASAPVRTRLIAFVDRKRAVQMSILGGKRGDIKALWEELEQDRAAINQELARLGSRFRPDLGLPPDDAPEPGNWLGQ